MKNSIFIVIGVAASLLLLPMHSFAAEGDLIVVFTPDPLFSKSNFLPGNEVEGTAEVTNNTAGAQDIIVEAINVADPDGFANGLRLKIMEGASTLYDDTLAAFFDAGEVSLSQLADNGGNTTYTFAISFDMATSLYQKSELGFDVLIGFKGDEGGDNGGGSGNGNGGGGTIGLSIYNEADVSVADVSAVINWVTSYKSTSRVVYGTVPNVFDFSSPPNYGYANSTAEFDTPAATNGVTGHSVTITGLASGTTYYYRVISHASPDTISREHSFTTKGIGIDEKASIFAQAGEISQDQQYATNALSGGTSGIAEEQNSAAMPLQDGPDTFGRGVAVSAAIPNFPEIGGASDPVNGLAALFFSAWRWWYVIILLFAVIMGWQWWKRYAIMKK